MSADAIILQLQAQARLAEAMRQGGIPIVHAAGYPYTEILYLDEATKTLRPVPRGR